MVSKFFFQKSFGADVIKKIVLGLVNVVTLLMPAIPTNNTSELEPF